MLHLDSLSQKIINWNPSEDAHFLDQQSRQQEHDILHSNHGTITSLDPSDFIPSSPDSANPIHSSPLSPLPDPPTNSSATFSHQPTLQHLNPHMALAEEKEAPLEIPQREEEEEEDSAMSPIQRLAQSASSSAPPAKADRPDFSRLSTPLSELSPPPDDEVLDTISATNIVNGAGHEGGGDARPDDRRSALLSEKMVGGRNGFSVDASESLREHNSSVSSALARGSGDNFMSATLHTPSRLSNMSGSPTHSLSMPPQTFDPFSLGTSLSSPMNHAHPSTTTTNSQDPRAVTILELNVELLKICMFLQSKGIGSADPRFQQFATRIQSNLAYLATIAETNRTATTFPLPNLEPFPAVDLSLASNPHLVKVVERIRQTYKDLPTIFAKDVVRRQSMNASIGMGMLPVHTSTQGSATAGVNTHPTSPPNHLKRERQEELGFVDNGASAKRRDTGEGKAFSPPGFASGPKNQHQQGQMMPPPSIPISNQGGANARVTSPPSNGPLTFSLPMTSGPSSMGQHQQHGQQHGNEQGQQKRQPSVPPPAPTRTPTPRTPSAGASHLSPPLARHPSLPPTPTTTSPPRQSSVPSSQSHLHFALSNSALNSSGQPINNAPNPGVASNAMTSSSVPNDTLNLPNFGINATEAQIAAVNRERMRQMQIKVAQQHAQQMRMAGAGGLGANLGMGMGGAGMGGNMGGMNSANSVGGGGGIAAGGMGMSGMGMGDMLPPGANPRMMPQQQQSHTGGMEVANAMSPSNMNVNVNQLVGPSGMAMATGMGGMQAGMAGGMTMSGIGSMSQGTAGGMGGQGGMGGGSGVGGPLQGAASQQQALFQQLYAVLRNPNHPMMKFMLQTVPGFENMPTNMQLQKLMNARNNYMQRQELASQQAAGQMNQMPGMRPPLPNMMQPSQQQHTNTGMGGGMGPSGMGNTMSGSSGNMGLGGNGMNASMIGQQSQQANIGAMSPVQSQFSPQSMMGMGGMSAGMDPRMTNANMAASTGLTSQQRNMLLTQQQQRMASGMQGGGSSGMGGAPFNNMGSAGNAPSLALHPQMVHERIRQQQQQQAQAQANRMSGRASSPLHVASPLGSDGGVGGVGGFSVASSATSSAAAAMRSGPSIPGIARSTRSPTDAPSPITTRGPQTRMPSMGQDDYQRMLFQQQQQAIRTMSTSSPAFNQQMMRNSPPQQQLAAQMQHHQQQAYGMSGPAPTPNFGGGMRASSPTSSQNWITPSHGGYPFSPPSAGNDQGHMTTPVPQQHQQQQHQPQIAPQNSSPDPLLYDLFNWNG